MTWLLTIWGKTKFYALAIGAALLAAFAAYWRIREDGKNAVRNEQAQANLDAVKRRKETDDEIAEMDTTSVDTAFDRWMRDE